MSEYNPLDPPIREKVVCAICQETVWHAWYSIRGETEGEPACGNCVALEILDS